MNRGGRTACLWKGILETLWGKYWLAREKVKRRPLPKNHFRGVTDQKLFGKTTSKKGGEEKREKKNCTFSYKRNEQFRNQLVSKQERMV